jgi:ribosome-associated toxin RatA of RatAB toxin-antitoxin module
MFDVVTQVDKYADYLPWCHESRVIEQSDLGMKASIGISLAGFKQSFTTQNTHTNTDSGGLRVDVALLDGPFSHLVGTWTFDPIAGSSKPACKITLQLSYEIKSKLLEIAIGPAFDKIAASMVDSFVTRAKSLYL